MDSYFLVCSNGEARFRTEINLVQNIQLDADFVISVPLGTLALKFDYFYLDVLLDVLDPSVGISYQPHDCSRTDL